jgi:hypothetical protein
MNRKVELRVVPGFEPGQHQPRPQAQQQRPYRPQQRHGHNQGQRRTHGQPAQKTHSHQGKPRSHGPHAEHLTREQDAQLKEAYARMAAEGIRRR